MIRNFNKISEKLMTMNFEVVTVDRLRFSSGVMTVCNLKFSDGEVHRLRQDKVWDYRYNHKSDEQVFRSIERKLKKYAVSSTLTHH